MIYVSFLRLKITIYTARKAQIALLLAKKVTVLAKYSDFTNVFLEKSANIFPEPTKVNKHAIKLEKDKQSSYRPIYSLGPVELKTFKIYIKTNLANNFIKTSKLPAAIPVLLVSKRNDNLCLCVNYQGLNNLTIENRNPLPLIGKSLDCLGQAK